MKLATWTAALIGLVFAAQPAIASDVGAKVSDLKKQDPNPHADDISCLCEIMKDCLGKLGKDALASKGNIRIATRAQVEAHRKTKGDSDEVAEKKAKKFGGWVCPTSGTFVLNVGSAHWNAPANKDQLWNKKTIVREELIHQGQPVWGKKKQDVLKAVEANGSSPNPGGTKIKEGLVHYHEVQAQIMGLKALEAKLGTATSEGSLNGYNNTVVSLAIYLRDNLYKLCCVTESTEFKNIDDSHAKRKEWKSRFKKCKKDGIVQFKRVQQYVGNGSFGSTGEISESGEIRLLAMGLKLKSKEGE